MSIYVLSQKKNKLFKVNKRKTCETCSKLIIKTPELRHWRRSGVFIVNLKHISHLFLVFDCLTFCTVEFGQVNVSWGRLIELIDQK